MTHEEIIAMAKEAGGYESPQYPENLVMDEHDLARFAAMVAAKEREACAQVCDGVENGEGETAGLACECAAAHLAGRYEVLQEAGANG